MGSPKSVTASSIDVPSAIVVNWENPVKSTIGSVTAGVDSGVGVGSTSGGSVVLTSAV